jgi:RNA polymerase sigma factor (sigma-70 family)
VSATETHPAIEAVWKIESARVIAGLTRIVRDVGVAEELAQDSLLAALEKWPESGIPDNPGAWLMGTAKHRAIDFLRHGTLVERKHADLGREIAARKMQVPDLAAAMDDNVGDDMLRLVFIACHPVLSTEARVALTLRLLGGLTTEEIARAYLITEAAMAQRIVRAKRALTDAHVPFEMPRGAEFRARLSSVLQVIYLIFNEGYSATAGDDWMRPALCEEALRLGAHFGRAGTQGAGSPRAGCTDGDSGVACESAGQWFGRTSLAFRSGSNTMGSIADRSRAGSARSRRAAWRGAGAVCDSSRDRRLSRASCYCRRDRLAANCGVVRRPRGNRSLPCG